MTPPGTSTSLHAPIPWVTGSPNYSGEPAIGILAGDEYGYVLADVHADVDGGLKTAEANAAFIVLAVNAHEVLRNAVTRLMSLAVADSLPDSSSEWQEAVDDAKAALILARGDQP